MPPENSHTSEPEFAIIDYAGRYVIALSHRYSKLRRPSDFRLLRLQPRSYFHPLETITGSPREFSPNAVFASLVNANLAQDVVYDCLSYTWGTEHDSQVVWIDESPVQIGRSLHRALRRLQRPDQPRLVWVDFLCINQQDAEERADQVRIMFQIYHGAREVVIDLGDAADGSEQVGVLMRQIWDKIVGKPVTLPSNEDRAWKAFRIFLQRPWFRRVWVVQEAFAARDLKVRCGDWYIMGDAFLAVIDFGMASSLPYMARHQKDVNPWQDNLLLGLECILLHIYLYWVRKGEPDQRGRKWSLIELLGSSRHHLSTDPRDRVFAFLSLCREADEPALQANYTETVAEIYIRVAKFFATRGQLSDVLCNAGLSSSTLGLPSWIPDWSLGDLLFEDISVKNAANPRIWQHTAGGQAVTEAAGEVELDDSCKSLKVTGFIIGRITQLGGIHKYSKNPHPEGVVCSDVQAADKLGTKPIGSTEASDGVATFRPRQLDNEAAEAMESMLRAAVPAIESLTEVEWGRLPVLFRFASEMLLQIRATDAYKDQDPFEVICRTMVCDREAMTLYQAPLAKYIHDFEAYFAACLASQPTRFQVFDFNQFDKTEDESETASSLEKGPKVINQAYIQHIKERWTGGLTFERAARRYCLRKRLGCTDQGLVGLVPHETVLNDHLVILNGVNVPMILRRVAGQEHQYIVVGQAFFHGFMYGEVFNMDEFESSVVTLI